MSNLPTYHIYHDTPEGRLPFTLIVFGPYGINTDMEWDVEMYRGHVTVDTRTSDGYVATFSSLPRKTHIIGDVWERMEQAVNKQATPA